MNETLTKEEWTIVIGIGVIAAIVFQIVFPWSKAWGDEVTYIRFSETPFIGGGAPWCYRLLTPLLASFCPLPIGWGYRLATAAGTAGVAIGVYYLARRLGSTPLLSGALFFLYALHPQCRYLSAHCGLVDPLTTLFVTLSCIAILFNRERLLGTVLLLGMLNHEAMLWMIPTVFIAYWIQRAKPSSLVNAGIVCLPASIAFVLTRIVLPMMNDLYIRQELIRKYFPDFFIPTRFTDYVMIYLFSRPPSEGGWSAWLSPNAFSGGVAVLIPLAIVGFYLSPRKAKSLAVFWLLLTLVNALIQARPEIMYVGFPIVAVYIAYLFQQFARFSTYYQSSFALAIAIGMLFLTNSWIAGIILAMGAIAILQFDKPTGTSLQSDKSTP